MEMTMDQFERLDSRLSNLLDEMGETRTETALQRQELGQIRAHLQQLNGRTGRTEERMTNIEHAAIEAKGAWKVIVAVASAVGGLASWLLHRILPVLICAVSLSATTTTINDTTLVGAVGGAAWTGRITVTLNNPSSAQPLYSGAVSLAGWQYILCVGVTGSDCTATTAAGVVTLAIHTNDTITPAGTSYNARYQPTRGAAYSETWEVTAGDTLLSQIRATTVPTPTTTFQESQITISAGAVIYGSSTGVGAELALGTIGYCLQAGATAPVWGACASGGGSGTVTSVALTMPAIFSVAGSPVTSAGTLAASLATQTANTIWSGPATGSAAAPTFRALVDADVPNTITIDLAATATALAANGANCSAGEFPLGVDASGAVETCTPLPTTITGTANQITASGSTGAITLSIPTNPTLPGTTTGTFSGNLTGAVTGNASTATALQTARTIGNVSFDGTANIVPETTAVIDGTDSTSFVLIVDSATGNLQHKTDAGLAYNASTGMLTATGLTGPLTGNASTATALAANPAACASGEYVTDIDANGTLTCATPAGGAHTQNTDSGTTQTSFQIDSGNSGPRIKNSSGTLQVRNAADAALAPLTASVITADSFATSGSGAGSLELTQGTAPSAGTTSVKLYADTAVTSYIMRLPSAAATGFILGTNSAGDVVQSFVSFTGTGDVVRATSPTLVTPALGTPSALVGTNISGTAASLTAGLATALAANGANCSGNLPRGVDASGAAEGCADVDLTTEVTGLMPVTNGGSGVGTLTGIIRGNGTSAFSAAALSDVSAMQYCRSTTGTDTYTCTVTPTMTAYTTGSCLVLNGDSANVGAASVNVDALGAITIVDRTGGTLTTADIRANRPVTICYDGTNYVLQGGTAAAGSAISSLEGQTGATQTFTDDTNVTIVSAADTHVITWSGTLAAARGGLGTSLSDPNADRLIFWDDSGGAHAYLTLGTGLSISTTTISVDQASLTLSSIGGAVTDGQVPNTITIDLAAAATALQTARTIAGVSFDGTANIAIASTGLSDTATLARLAAANVFTRGQTITGSADEVQMRVTAHSTQTNFIAVWEQQDGTDLMRLSNDGTLELLLGSGPFTLDEQSAPSTPAAGKVALWADPTDETLKVKDDGGNISTTVRADAGASNQFLTGITTAGVITKAQPAFSDLSGTATTGQLPSASTSASGIAEAAIASEVTTGSDAARYVTPDALRGSDYGISTLAAECVADATALSTGDGKCYLGPIPARFNGYNIVSVVVGVGAVVSSSGAVTVDIDRCGVVATGVRCSGTNASIFSTLPTIDANEDSTSTAATASVINGANDDLTTDQWLRVNIDGAGTSTQGLYVWVNLQKP